MMRKLSVLAAFLAAALPALAQSEAWKNETLPIGDRVEALLETLTVDEKIDLLRATSPGVPRVGIDKYYHGNEALHGIVRPGNFTVFPQAIALSAMWNPDLLERISGVVSDEARARWNELERGKKQTAQYSDLLTFWSPTVNMARDPRWGRTPETYGEDPFLSGENGAAFVRGLQGYDPRYLKVVSTPKHFTANNEEHNRFECNAGRYEGDEVAQVYVRLPEYEGKAPISELRGFQRVHLKREETRAVTVSLRREDLRYWSETRQAFVVPEGLPEIWVGASSRDIRLTWPLE